MYSYHHRRRLYASSLFFIGLIIANGGCDSQSAITDNTDRDILPATVVTGDDFEVAAAPTDQPGEWQFTMKRKPNSSADSLRFEWDFGQGSLKVGESLSHTFSDPGSYSITVTAIDGRDRVAFVLTLEITVPDTILTASLLQVSAGSNQSVGPNALVFLDGSATEEDPANPLDYLWTQIAGPAVLLSNADAPIASFISPVFADTEDLVFALSVTDEEFVGEDTVVVTIAGDANNVSPTCEFTVTLDNGSNPAGTIDGPGPLNVVCVAHDSSGAPLTTGVPTWSINGVAEVGSEGTDYVRTATFTNSGIHTIALALTVSGVTVGCKSTRTQTQQESITVWPAILGTISLDDGSGVSGVAVSASPGGTTDVTDANGLYSVNVPYNWSGSITPQHISYSFTPTAQLIASITSDLSSQDFTAADQPIITLDCFDDSDCDDFVYCNGAEVCNAGTCEAGGDPCAGQLCNEITDSCGECLNDADCDNGDYCDGPELCKSGICVQGATPCPGQSCDEPTDSCTGCLSDSECDDLNPCTDDSCDGTGQCVFTNDDTNSCNDGLFCNGTETCSAGGCVSANPPCSGFSCNESTDSCVTGVIVSGSLKYFDTAPATGLTVQLTGTGGSAGNDFTVITDGSGNFQQAVPGGWSGTIGSDVNYRFSPATRILSNLSASAPNQNFDAFRNYYVAKTGSDSSAGTFTNEFATINRAAMSVNPGDTVYVKAGTYNEWVRITKNGTAANRITFRNYQNDVVTIHGQGVRHGCLTVGYHDRYSGGRYITVDGFHLTGTRNGTGAGDGGACALMWHSQHSEFKNLTAYRCGQGTPIADGSLAAGIALRGANHDCVVDSCHVYENYRSGILVSQAGGSTPGSPMRVTVNDCYIHHNPGTMPGDDEDSDGLWVAAGVGHDTHIQITNCVVHDNADDGIDAPSTRGALIANNIVFDQGRNTSQGDGNGIKVSTSVGGAPNGGGNHVIRHNYVFDNARGGIDQDISSDAPHNFFYNNTIYGNANHGLILDVGGGANLDTAAVSVNNLMYNNNLSGGSFLDYRAGSGGCGNLTQGNTILDSNFNLVGDGCLHINEGPKTLTVNPLLTNPNASINTSWQGSTKTTMDFIRSQVFANFTLQAGSPAIDAGRDLNMGLTAVDDPKGNTGSGAVSYFDIGAHERGGTP